MSIIGPDPTLERRVRRAQLVARVSHPNLVRMVPRAAGGYSSALEGAQPLSHFSGASAPFRSFELEHAVRILLDVLNGLAVLHDLVIDGRPVVHGCVSPGRICVDAHGQARLVPLAHPHSTAEAAPELNGYAAPEWLLGSEVDPRADLFSVGALLWEALAGRRLFPEPSPAVVLARLASGTVPRPTVPSGAEWAQTLCLVAERALAPEPADRPGSARELSRSIATACGPRLMRPLGERWQDEAPTLRFRLRPAVNRTFTPPGFVIDLLAPVELERAALVESARRTPVPAVAQPGAFALSPPLAPPATPPRGPLPRASVRPWLLGAMAATYLALFGWLSAPRVAVQPPTTPAAAAPAATLTPPVASVSASAAPAAPAALPAPPLGERPATDAPAPVVSPSIAPATSSTPPRLRRSAPVRRRTSVPNVADYGI